MLQKEFEDLTGKKFTAEDYAAIEEMYMNVMMTKQQFAQCWNLCGNNLFTQELNSTIRELKKENQQIKEDCKKMETALSDILLVKAHRYDDNDLYEWAETLIGTREVVLAKIRLGLQLSEEDRAYIRENLH